MNAEEELLKCERKDCSFATLLEIMKSPIRTMFSAKLHVSDWRKASGCLVVSFEEEIQ
ncbi:MAG: hypothetical protein WCH76_05835 [Candidatus Riflemargulisbacteria bacterium]